MRRRNKVRRKYMYKRCGPPRKRIWLFLLFLLVAIAYALPQLGAGVLHYASMGIDWIQSYCLPRAESATLTLDEMTVYALQLGVFDSGTRASEEAKRLEEQGAPCVIWQREQMRLICAVAFSAEELSAEAAKGMETYVYRDVFPAVTVKLTANRGETEEIRALFALPDEVLNSLLTNRTIALDELCSHVREIALRQQNKHPEQPVHAQLVQSLLDWCELCGKNANHDYAAAAMSTLCRELRRTLAGT